MLLAVIVTTCSARCNDELITGRWGSKAVVDACETGAAVNLVGKFKSGKELFDGAAAP